MASIHPISIAVARPYCESSYRVLDYGFRVRTNIPEVAELVHDLLGHWEVADANGAPIYHLSQVREEPPRFTLYRDGECVQGEARAYSGGMIDFLLSDVTRRVMDGPGRFFVVHASAASWKGRGILMPAAADSGKTTTVAGLTAAGFVYLTDEAALIDPDSGLMHAYPRPLSMDRNTLRIVPGLYERLPPAYHAILGRQQYHVPSKYLGPGPSSGECPVSYVVIPSYVSGATTSLEPMTRAETLMSVIANCFNFERFGGRGLYALQAALADARGYRLRIGDLQEGVATIRDIVTAEP